MNHDMIRLCYAMKYLYAYVLGQDYESTLLTILVPPPIVQFRIML